MTNPTRNYAIEWILRRAGLTTTQASAIAAAVIAGADPVDATGDVFGDVSGSLLGPLNVVGLLASPIDGPATDGTVLRYDESADTWIPDTPASMAGELEPQVFVLRDFAHRDDGTTDDTVALQAAIQAAFDAGGGIVDLPDRHYVLGGALQDTGSKNAQLLLPTNTPPTSYDAGGATTKIIRIVLRGRGGEMNYWFNNADPGGVTVLESTIAPAVVGSPAVFAGANVDATFFAGANWIVFHVEDLVLRLPDNPHLTGFQMRAVMSFTWKNISIDTASDLLHASEPTHANSYGIDGIGVNAISTEGSSVWIANFYSGMRANENLSTALDPWFINCKVAIEFTGMHHASHIKRMSVVHCTRALKFSGGGPPNNSYVIIDQLDIEHADASDGFSTWQLPIADVDDASNYARGYIGWHTVLWGTGVDDNLIMNGGAYLSLFDIQRGRWRLTDTVHLPAAATDPTDNPASGGLLYAAHTGGHPSWRDTAGVVHDLLAPASSGAAGGDLSGTYPNPTVAKINGVAVTGVPAVGYVPTATGPTAATWQALSSVTAAAVRDAGRWEPTVDDGTDTLIFDGHTVVMDWITS